MGDERANNKERTAKMKAPSNVRLSLFAFRFASLPFILAIRLYQVTLGPLMGGHCRFHPTCSAYAIEAYRVHGVFRGTILTVRRLSRCHPLGGGGYDPVPMQRREALKTPGSDVPAGSGPRKLVP